MLSEQEIPLKNPEVMDNECNHTWTIFSMIVKTKCLILKCEKCKLEGILSNPTKKEWNKSFHTSKPYKWMGDDNRISFDTINILTFDASEINLP